MQSTNSPKFFPDEPVPPDKFVGRTSELYTISDKINSRGHVAIYGSSGMGKTSLLKYIQSPNFWQEKGLDFSKALIVYQNCETSFTIDNFWEKVLEELRNQAEDDEDIKSEINNVLNQETIEIIDIRQILRNIGEKDKFFLLLLDDYHGIVGTQTKDHKKSREKETFLSELRNLAVHSTEGQYFSTIVTTFQKLHELGPVITRAGSPWYNHYSYLPLKPFSPDDVNKYFFKSKSESRSFISIPQDIQKEKVLEMTGGYPGLLQCTGDIFSGRFDPVDLDTLKTKLKGYANKIFQDIWTNFEKNEQNILKLIAIDNSKGNLKGKFYSLDRINEEFTGNSSILNGLKEKGIIYQFDQLNKHNFYSSLLKDFVGEQLEDKNVSIAEDSEIVINLLNIKITRGRWNKIKEIIQPVIKPLQSIARILNCIANILPGK